MPAGRWLASLRSRRIHAVAASHARGHDRMGETGQAAMGSRHGRSERPGRQGAVAKDPRQAQTPELMAGVLVEELRQALGLHPVDDVLRIQRWIGLQLVEHGDDDRRSADRIGVDVETFICHSSNAGAVVSDRDSASLWPVGVMPGRCPSPTGLGSARSAE
jgi:hypothetical protein